MLPSMEQQALYNAANFSFAPGQVGQQGYVINSTAYESRIAGFLCPSDGNAGRTNINSYHGSVGTTTYNCCNTGAINTTGVFGYVRGSTTADITDGTSNTIAFSEALVGNRVPGPLPGNSIGNVSSAGGSNQADASRIVNALQILKTDAATCQAAFIANPTNTVGMGRGNHWGCGAMGYTLFNTVYPPGANQWSACRMDCCAQAQHAHYQNANSNHSGGVNVLFADGSVKFIKNSISWPTWWALGTAFNGEVVSSDAY